MILFIKHIAIEGPETLAPFLRSKGFQLKEIDLSKGDSLPKVGAYDHTPLQAVFCLGGPMNVYEEEKYPFLKEEDTFIKRILEKEIPFIGICLGAQLLAKACGAGIVKSPEKEMGFSKVTLTPEGKNDPLFSGMDPEIEVFQWHEDMFEIPVGANPLSGTGGRSPVLATSQACPNQVFKVGKNAYGLQFHVEITDKSIREWSGAYFKKEDQALQAHSRQMLEDYQQKKENFHSQAQKIYNNLLCSVLPLPRSTQPSGI